MNAYDHKGGDGSQDRIPVNRCDGSKVARLEHTTSQS